jgi:hypothetical protein
MYNMISYRIALPLVTSVTGGAKIGKTVKMVLCPKQPTVVELVDIPRHIIVPIIAAIVLIVFIVARYE